VKESYRLALKPAQALYLSLVKLEICRSAIIIFLILFVVKGSAQVVVHESVEDSIIVSEITCFIDHQGNLSKEEVENLPFSENIEEAIELLAKNNFERRFWFKFNVKAVDSISEDIAVSFPPFSEITVYVRDDIGKEEEKKVGVEDLGNYYFVDSNQKVAPLLQTGQEAEVLVAVRHRSRMFKIQSFYAFIATKKHFDQVKMKYRPSKGGDGYVFLLFCGIMMFQGLYVLLQWYLVRKREYFYYGAFILSVFIYYYLRFSAFYAENETWAFTDATDVQHFNDALLIIPIIFYLLFASSFVDLRKRDYKLYMAIRIFVGFLFLCLIAQVLLLNTHNDINKMIPILIVLFFQIPFNIYALIRIARQKRRIAWFLVIGSSVAFLSHLLANLIPVLTTATSGVLSPLEITMLGLIIEVIIFNGGLLVKAKESDRERIEAQKSYIEELKNRQSLQAEFAEVRDKISSDLHDDVGSSLSSIGIYSYAAKENLQAGKTVQASELLENIRRSAETTLNAMSDLVWATNPRNDSNDKLIERIRSFGFEILSARECIFKTDIDEEFYLLELNQADRKNLLLILKEAINNSAKYAEASEVRLTIRVLSNTCQVQITDDGIGIMTNAEQGNGMRTMRKRAEDMEAEFDLFTGEEGTTIKITF